MLEPLKRLSAFLLNHEPAQDEESLGWLNVTRSVWRNTVGDPKTAKSKAPVPVIPQLAQKLDAHRKTACWSAAEATRSG